MRPPDEPGLWHHVSTRALARRPLFEVEEDYRFFLEKLAEAVADERIEVHSYCLMTNHFHLLVRSSDGELSATVRDVLSQYARWFNVRRDRDGPLVKGRFFSRVLHGPQERFIVVRYIDQNPLKARLVRSVVDYRYGSAWHYANRSGPEWLSRHDVEEAVMSIVGAPVYDPETYARVFDPPATDACDWLVEQRLRPGAERTDALETLLGASPTEVQDWLQQAARLADGVEIGHLFAQPDAVLAAVEARRRSTPEWLCRPTKRRACGWTIMAAGLLRTASRQTLLDTARRLKISKGRAERCIRDHRILMAADATYARRAAGILHAEFRQMVPEIYLRRRTGFPVRQKSRGAS